jgi:hypothetical protein
MAARRRMVSGMRFRRFRHLPWMMHPGVAIFRRMHMLHWMGGTGVGCTGMDMASGLVAGTGFRGGAVFHPGGTQRFVHGVADVVRD